MSTYNLQRDIVIPAGTELFANEGATDATAGLILAGGSVIVGLTIDIDADILRKNPRSRIAERIMAAFEYARDNGLTLADVEAAIKAAKAATAPK